jgi:hypothetical protein
MKRGLVSRGKRTLGILLRATALLSLVQGNTASATSWNVSCCAVFESMTKFTVERTGSYLQADTCRASETKCMDLKLIHEFIEQSRVIMGRHNVEAFAGSSVIRFTLQSDMDTASVVGLLAWAFLGRIVSSREQSNKQTVLLQYDIHQNRLLIQRDSCEINKGLYSAMILASVTLLIFFISMMVSDSVRHKMEKQKGVPVKASNTETQTHAGPATLMNKNPIFGPLTPEIFRESRQFDHKETRPGNFEHGYALVWN